MARVSVHPVANGSDWKRFLALPRRIYRRDPLWPALPASIERASFDPAAEPELKGLEVRPLLADSGGATVGRIAAFIRRDGTGLPGAAYWGFFECVNDRSVSAALLSATESFAADRGRSLVVGPMNYSNLGTFALLTEGFGIPPRILTAYNPDYYPGLVTDAGYAIIEEFRGYQHDKASGTEASRPGNDLVAKRLNTMERMTIRRGVRVRPVDMNSAESESELLTRLYNASFAEAPGFIPLTVEKSLAFFRDLARIADPGLVTVALEDGGAEPAGLCLMLPDANAALRAARWAPAPLWLPAFLLGRRRIDALRLAVLGVVPGRRRSGATCALIGGALRAYLRSRYARVEISLVGSANRNLIHIVEGFGCRLVKRWGLYGKRI